jgi:hypothetical protein
VRAATAWYAKHLGVSPATYLHRPAVEFADGSVIVFEATATLNPATHRVREIGVFVPPTSDAQENSASRKVDDPWGTTIAFVISDRKTGLAHVVVRTQEPEPAGNALAALAPEGLGAVSHLPEQTGFRLGQAWIILEEAPADASLHGSRLGVVVDDLAALRPRLADAGATNFVGPARFADAYRLEMTLFPGIQVELIQTPPRGDAEPIVPPQTRE